MNLQPRIIFILIFISLTINILFQYNIISNQKQTSIHFLSRKIQQTNTLMSKINSAPLYYKDIKILEENIITYLKDPDIKSINIYEIDGEINLFLNDRETTDKDIIKKDSDIIFNGRKIGVISIVYSRDLRNSIIKQSIEDAILLILIESIIKILSLIIILRSIIKPIKELTRLTVDISDGNLDKNISTNRTDEIGQLTKSFIKMRDSIKDKIESLSIENKMRIDVEKQLKLHKETLEEQVNLRTIELQESIDNLESAKEKLIDSEKMASLGDLVAGVSHEINTPIGIGVTAASHLKYESKDFYKIYKNEGLSRSKFEAYINLVSESSEIIFTNMVKASELIKSFKKVAVDQSSDGKRVFNICEYIHEIILSINSKFKHTKHKVNIQCDNKILLDSYPGAFSQVLINLCINSLQHGFEDIKEGIIDIEIIEEPEQVIIEYSDNGLGIPSEIISKIYDPFFTTKRGKGGSGLGMNIVQNLIITTLKGTINCSSTVGKGTKFTIILPKNI